MNALIYGIILQFKLDLRSKTMLITCYLVPLLFYAIMGTIFTSIMPQTKGTIIQSMTIMGISMGAIIGMPQTLLEIYSTDIKKMYLANGIPNYFGLVTLLISSFLHLIVMSLIIVFSAPFFFHISLPSNIFIYFISLLFFILVSLSLSCILGLFIKNQAKLTMFTQIFFLPSIMLSGIMFPVELLPSFLQILGKLFPAYWGYIFLSSPSISTSFPLIIILSITIFINYILLRKLK